MKRHQIAAQLYTIRDFLQTPEDIAQSMKKIRAIGYEAVQVSGMALMDESELMRILDGEGLTCCATHEATKMIVEEPQRVVERLQKLGCKYTAVPSPGQFELKTQAQAIEYSKRINDAGKVLHENGQVLTYHNHHMEFSSCRRRTDFRHDLRANRRALFARRNRHLLGAIWRRRCRCLVRKIKESFAAFAPQRLPN